MGSTQKLQGSQWEWQQASGDLGCGSCCREVAKPEAGRKLQARGTSGIPGNRSANRKWVGRDVNQSGGNCKHGAATGVIPGRLTRKWWVDFMTNGGGPRRVLWEPRSLLGLHSYRAQREALCARAAEWAMPRSCGAALLGVRCLKSVPSPDGFPGLKRDPETDRRFTR